LARKLLRRSLVKPLTEKALAAMAAALAVEYRTYKDVPRCVRYDIDRLTSLGFVREHGGKVLADVPCPNVTSPGL
jgi:repressor of nif and glnA expression